MLVALRGSSPCPVLACPCPMSHALPHPFSWVASCGPRPPSLLALSHVISSVVASALGCGFSQRTFADSSSRTGVRRVPACYLLVLHALERGPAELGPSRQAGLTSAIPTAVHRHPRRQTHVSHVVRLAAQPGSAHGTEHHPYLGLMGAVTSREEKRAFARFPGFVTP